MSTTASPTDGGNLVKQETSEVIDSSSCHADVSADTDEDLEHRIVTLAGRVPNDSPYWNEQLHPDARGLQALSIRYVTKMEASMIFLPGSQAIARDAIWSKLSQLLPPSATPRGLPRIYFNERPLVDGTRRGVIDLVFSSKSAFDAATQLKKLQFDIEGDNGHTPHTFLYRTRTRLLAGNILAVQCLGLPIDDLDPEALFKAFTSMSSAVGSVLGFAKIVIQSEVWQIAEQYSGEVRFWIEIKPDNMATPWSRLIKKLPTHARINGFPYALSYANRELHSEDVFSSNYTIPPADEKDSKASIKRSRASNEGANSSTSRRKKVKKQEEEEEEEEEEA